MVEMRELYFINQNLNQFQQYQLDMNIVKAREIDNKTPTTNNNKPKSNNKRQNLQQQQAQQQNEDKKQQVHERQDASDQQQQQQQNQHSRKEPSGKQQMAGEQLQQHKQLQQLQHDHRKQNHCEIEKRRRDKMNQYIMELASIIPAFNENQPKFDKLTVLRMAVQHVRSLRSSLCSFSSFHLRPSFLSSGNLLKNLILQMASQESQDNLFMVVTCDRGKVLFVSESSKEILNQSQKELVGQYLFDILHKDDVTRVKEQISYFNFLPREMLVDSKTFQPIKNGQPRQSPSQLENKFSSTPQPGARRSFFCRMKSGRQVAAANPINNNNNCVIPRHHHCHHHNHNHNHHHQHNHHHHQQQQQQQQQHHHHHQNHHHNQHAQQHPQHNQPNPLNQHLQQNLNNNQNQTTKQTQQQQQQQPNLNHSDKTGIVAVSHKNKHRNKSKERSGPSGKSSSQATSGHGSSTCSMKSSSSSSLTSSVASTSSSMIAKIPISIKSLAISDQTEIIEDKAVEDQSINDKNKQQGDDIVRNNSQTSIESMAAPSSTKASVDNDSDENLVVMSLSEISESDDATSFETSSAPSLSLLNELIVDPVEPLIVAVTCSTDTIIKATNIITTSPTATSISSGSLKSSSSSTSSTSSRKKHCSGSQNAPISTSTGSTGSSFDSFSSKTESSEIIATNNNRSVSIPSLTKPCHSISCRKKIDIASRKGWRYIVMHCTGYLKCIMLDSDEFDEDEFDNYDQHNFMDLDESNGGANGRQSDNSGGNPSRTIMCLVAVCRRSPMDLSFKPDQPLTFTCRYSMEGKFVFVDQKTTIALGYTPQQLLGTSHYAYCNKDSVNTFKECHKQCILKSEAVSSDIYQFKRANGQHLWLQTSLKSFRNPWTKFIDYIVANHTTAGYPEPGPIMAHNAGFNGEPTGTSSSTSNTSSTNQDMQEAGSQSSSPASSSLISINDSKKSNSPGSTSNASSYSLDSCASSTSINAILNHIDRIKPGGVKNFFGCRGSGEPMALATNSTNNGKIELGANKTTSGNKQGNKSSEDSGAYSETSSSCSSSISPSRNNGSEGFSQGTYQNPSENLRDTSSRPQQPERPANYVEELQQQQPNAPGPPATSHQQPLLPPPARPGLPAAGQVSEQQPGDSHMLRSNQQFTITNNVNRDDIQQQQQQQQSYSYGQSQQQNTCIIVEDDQAGGTDTSGYTSSTGNGPASQYSSMGQYSNNNLRSGSSISSSSTGGSSSTAGRSPVNKQHQQPTIISNRRSMNLHQQQQQQQHHQPPVYQQPQYQPETTYQQYRMNQQHVGTQPSYGPTSRHGKTNIGVGANWPTMGAGTGASLNLQDSDMYETNCSMLPISAQNNPSASSETQNNNEAARQPAQNYVITGPTLMSASGTLNSNPSVYGSGQLNTYGLESSRGVSAEASNRHYQLTRGDSNESIANNNNSVNSDGSVQMGPSIMQYNIQPSVELRSCQHPLMASNRSSGPIRQQHQQQSYATMPNLIYDHQPTTPIQHQYGQPNQQQVVNQNPMDSQFIDSRGRQLPNLTMGCGQPMASSNQQIVVQCQHCQSCSSTNQSMILQQHSMTPSSNSIHQQYHQHQNNNNNQCDLNNINLTSLPVDEDMDEDQLLEYLAGCDSECHMYSNDVGYQRQQQQQEQNQHQHQQHEPNTYNNNIYP